MSSTHTLHLTFGMWRHRGLRTNCLSPILLICPQTRLSGHPKPASAQVFHRNRGRTLKTPVKTNKYSMEKLLGKLGSEILAPLNSMRWALNLDGFINILLFKILQTWAFHCLAHLSFMCCANKRVKHNFVRSMN